MTAQEFQALLIEGGIDQETVAKLTGNVTITTKVLAQTGNGSVSAAPGWVDPATLAASPSIAVVAARIALRT